MEGESHDILLSLLLQIYCNLCKKSVTRLLLTVAHNEKYAQLQNSAKYAQRKICTMAAQRKICTTENMHNGSTTQNMHNAKYALCQHNAKYARRKICTMAARRKICTTQNIIIIYHDFLLTPRRGSHVKSSKTHTQSSRYTH